MEGDGDVEDIEDVFDDIDLVFEEEDFDLS